MEYGDIYYLKQSLESLQLGTARIVTGAIKLTFRQLIFDETGWETLQTGRSNHKLIKNVP
jgi:hypothetical protein